MRLNTSTKRIPKNKKRMNHSANRLRMTGKLALSDCQKHHKEVILLTYMAVLKSWLRLFVL